MLACRRPSYCTARAQHGWPCQQLRLFLEGRLCMQAALDVKGCRLHSLHNLLLISFLQGCSAVQYGAGRACTEVLVFWSVESGVLNTWPEPP